MIITLVEQAEHCHTAHVGPYQDARVERAARSAYARLSSCTEGASLNIVRSITNHDGFEAYRRLARRWGTSSAGDQFVRLTALLQANLGKGEEFLDKLTTWERGLDEYQRQSRE